MKTLVYVDGFNLYYGCLKGTTHGWLNPVSLVKQLVRPHHRIEKLKYFTARVSAVPTNRHAPALQETYLRALRTLPEVELIFGHFLTSKAKRPLADGSGWVTILRTEEKGSDVNLATHLVADAFLGRYQAALVVSNDSDLCEPIRVVTRDIGLGVGVLMPLCRPGRRKSRALQKVATFWKPIRRGAVAASQFPDVVSWKGQDIHKPDSWNRR